MAKITKVKSACLERLNNAEYRTFMTRYGNLPAGGGSNSEPPDGISFNPNNPLGIPQESHTAFTANFALLINAVNQSSASEETVQMPTLDKERDDLLIFITPVVTQMTKSPLAAQHTAAEKPYPPVKPYTGTAHPANLQETTAIKGLLVDLDKDDMPGVLTVSTLTEIVASLKEKGQQYAALVEQRTNVQAGNPVESAKKIRLRMDEGYDETATYVFVQSVVKPTATTATSTDHLNAFIDETNVPYNRRIVQARAIAAKKRTDSELPSEM